MFLEISQNSQENTCARDSFLIKLQALGKISKNTFFYRTTPMAWLWIYYAMDNISLQNVYVIGNF